MKHSPYVVDHVKRKKPTTAAATTNSTINLINAVNLKENGCLTGINKIIRANESLSSLRSFRQMNRLVRQSIIIIDYRLSFERFQIDLKLKHCQKFAENNLCIPCIQLIAFCWNGNENINFVIAYCLIHIDSNHCRKIAIPLIFLTCNRNERAFQHFSEFDNESNGCVWLNIWLSLILFTNCIYFEPKQLDFSCRICNGNDNGNSKRSRVITFLKRLLSYTSTVSQKYYDNNVNDVCQIAKTIFDSPQSVCSTTPNRIDSVASSTLLATSLLLTSVTSLQISVSIQLIYTMLKMKFNSVITATLITPILTSTNDIDIETSILNSSMPSLNHTIVSLCHIQRSLLNKPIKQCQCSDHQCYDTIMTPYTDQTNHNNKFALKLLSLPLPQQQMATASPLPLLSSLSSSYICNFVTRYSSTSDLFLTNKINTYNNYINNEKTSTTNPDQKWCDNALENCGKHSIITKKRHRQSSPSKRIFITFTSLHIDIRKMFISVLIPLMLFCNMLPISGAGK